MLPDKRYAYTAYGLPTILNASASIIATSAISNRYTYTGREWDATLGLHHFRARWMSPIAGRFLSRDPIGYGGGRLLYAYVRSNPFGFIDPTGLNKCCVKDNTICSMVSKVHQEDVEVAVPDPRNPGKKIKVKVREIMGGHAARIRFNEDCECFCKCCAVEQWIRGSYQILTPDGDPYQPLPSPVLPGSPGEEIDEEKYKQDSKQMSGDSCEVMFIDSPGVKIPLSQVKRYLAQGFQLDIHLEFEIRVLDICDGGKVIETYSHTMDIKGPFDKLEYKSSLRKCDKEFDAYIDEWDKKRNQTPKK